MSKWSGKRFIAALASVGSLALGCGVPPMPEQIPTGDWSVLQQQLDGLVDAATAGGGAMVVQVSAGGETVHLATGGTTPNNQSPSATTPFRIGSVSKVFTALTVLRLHEDGVLDLDAPLEDQLPNFSLQSRFDDAAPITPRDVLTHHSGLPSDFMKGMLADEALSLAELAEAVNGQYVTQPPGGWMSYSNLGYGLLGYLAQERAGEAFPDLVDRLILTPCGMNDTTWDASASIDGVVGAEAAVEGAQISTYPAGSLVSTARDMSAFGQGLLNGGRCPEGRIVQEETLDDAWQVWHRHPFDLDATWGLGFQIHEGLPSMNGKTLVGHNGATALFHTQFFLVPEDNLFAVAFTNNANLAGQTAEAALRSLQIALETQGDARPDDLVGAPQPAAVSPYTDDELDDLAGWYGTEAGIMRLRRDGSQVRAHISGSEARLLPTDEGSFAVSQTVFGLFPLVLPDVELHLVPVDGTVVMGARNANSVSSWMPIGSRFDPELAPRAWRERFGLWTAVSDVATDTSAIAIREVDLVEQAGAFLAILTLETPARTQYQSMGLLNVDDTQVITAGTGRFAGETLEVTLVDGEETLWVMGMPFRR